MAATSQRRRALLTLMPAASLVLKDSAELRVPWLPSVAGERFGFRVSTCDEGISLTDAARFD